MNKPSQETIDKLIAYFNEQGMELSVEEGEKLPLDQKILEERGDKWSVDVLILTGGGVCNGYYRHENKKFTANYFWPNPLEHITMLSNKFLLNTKEHNDNTLAIVQPGMHDFD